MNEDFDLIQEKINNVKVSLSSTMKKLIYSDQILMKVIERAIKYDPPSNKYQLKFLDQINKELARGQTESTFWKDKLVLQKVETDEKII